MLLPREKRARESSAYMCPITHELMVDPVQASDGWTYEASALAKWLETRNTSPLDPSLHLDIGLLRPNRAVRDAIEELVESGDLDDTVAETWRAAVKDLDSAPELFRNGRILEAAELGYPQAQGTLAWKYYEGDGVAQDLEQSLKWARKAACGGDGAGQYRVAYAYHTGEGLQCNWVEAVKYYSLAYHNGMDLACNNICEMYSTGGYGLPQNDSKLFEWCSKSTSAKSLHMLGMCHYEGRGNDKDFPEARRNFKLASSECTESQFMLGKMLLRGEGGPTNLSQGFKFIEQAAKSGHTDARRLREAVIAECARY